MTTTLTSPETLRLVRIASNLIEDDTPADSEYMRGMVELICDTFYSSNDGDEKKSTVDGMIRDIQRTRKGFCLDGVAIPEELV